MAKRSKNDVIIYDLLKKHNANEFIQCLVNVLSTNKIKISEDEIKDIYKTLYYAQ